MTWTRLLLSLHLALLALALPGRMCSHAAGAECAPEPAKPACHGEKDESKAGRMCCLVPEVKKAAVSPLHAEGPATPPAPSPEEAAGPGNLSEARSLVEAEPPPGPPGAVSPSASPRSPPLN